MISLCLNLNGFNTNASDMASHLKTVNTLTIGHNVWPPDGDSSRAAKDTDAKKAIQRQIVGKWESVIMNAKSFNEMPESGFDAFSKDQIKEFHFGADSSFKVIMSNGARETTGNGKWTISPDGTKLLLNHNCSDDLPTSYEIKYLEIDELVIAPAGVEEEPRNIYFNKF